LIVPRVDGQSQIIVVFQFEADNQVSVDTFWVTIQHHRYDPAELGFFSSTGSVAVALHPDSSAPKDPKAPSKPPAGAISLPRLTG
jgi:hypothetical protein